MANLAGVQWQEYVEDMSTCEMSFDHEGARASMVLQCEWRDVYDLVRSLLGYSIRLENNGVARLSRVPPERHPLYDWLFVTGVSNIRGMGPMGTDALVQPVSLGTHSDWEKARFTVNFSTLDYDIKTDEQLAGLGEWYRYTRKLFEYGSEGLNLQQGAYKWAEGDGGLAGKDIPGGKSQIVSQATLNYEWLQVPHDCIFNSDDFLANIWPVMGCINDAAWNGWPKRTLLCLPPKLKPWVSPFRPGDLNASNRIWDVGFKFLYKNPPSFGPIKGHNLAPAPGKDYWAYFTVDGNPASKSLYPEADFTKLFESL